MAKKKWKKRLKKLAKAALIGGALYGGAKLLGRGKGADAVSTAGQAIGVDRITPKTDYITKKVVAEPAATTGTDKFLPRVHPGTLLNQRKKIPGYGTAVAPPGILNPYRHGAIKGRLGDRLKGGGIAKRGTGVALKHGGRTGKQFGGGLGSTARRDMRSGYYPSDMGMRGGTMYKKGGRVKSMGVAKRGGGVAKK